MKKIFLFMLLAGATAMYAEDAVLVEKFSHVGNVATGTYTWKAVEQADLCTWSAYLTARRKQDTIHTANQKQAIWMSVSSNGAAKVSTTDWQYGIKAVEFKYARYGSEKTAGRVLQLKVSVGTTEDNTPTYAGNAMKVGNGTSAAHETYSHAFNSKSKDAQLSIENISTYTEDLTENGICRICVGDITITPYLIYTTTKATFDMSLASKFKNDDLIDNTEGEGSIVYSISENTIGATIDAATGEVTGSQAGTVTVTATWGEIATSYELTILAKHEATAKFDAENIRIKFGDAVPANDFTTNSSAAPKYTSSKTEVAEVDETTGAVTVKAAGTTVITAKVAENSDYTEASASYTLRIDPENFNMESFVGANNVKKESASTYLSDATVTPASENTGIVWTTRYGSVRYNVGNFGEDNIAVALRGKKTDDAEYAYLVSSVISGGIDSLAFDWNSNGNESGREHPWNIEIYINDTKVGAITDACEAQKPAGSQFRYTLGGLKTNGDFVIKIVNKNEADDGSSNQYRWVMDNLEWYSYCQDDYGMLVDGTDYIAGERDWSKAHMEFKIVAELNAGQVVEFMDNCSKGKFGVQQEENPLNYWFANNGGQLSAPVKGKYTVYLKMYGVGDNWLWTECVPDTSMGVEEVQNTEYKVQKTFENGQLIIIREGKKYNAQGAAL